MKQGRNRIEQRWQRLETVFCLFLVIGICLLAGPFVPYRLAVQAASASISIETEETEIQVGDTITVKLVIESADRLGDFETFLTYHAEVLEFQEGEAPVTGGDGILRISDIEPMERTRKRTYEFMFKAIAVGGCEVAIQDKAHVYADDGGKEMSVSSNSLSIQVVASGQASSENRLESLKVSPGELTPEFSPEIESYEIEVEEEVTSLVISAVPEDTRATVNVTGNEHFSEGENQVEVTVTAENADSRVYRIRVLKMQTGQSLEDPSAAEKENGENQETDSLEDPPKENKKEDTADKDSFYIKEKDGGVEFFGYYHYLVSEPPQTAVSALPDYYVPYNLVLFGKKIPAYRELSEGSSENSEPAKVLVYVAGKIGEDGEVLRGDTGFYEFDSTSKSMEKIQFRDREKATDFSKEVDTEAPWILYIIIAGLTVLCIFLGIGLVQMGKKYYEAKRDSNPNHIR